MKTFKKFINLCIFVILAMHFTHANAQEIMINGSFSSDTTFDPFNGEKEIYSFKMAGGINLLSDSSLVRVVLIDHYGNHYLIYEAYPLIDTSYNFSITDVCDETCYLDKITPDSIRVDIINAIASIDKFTYDLTPVNNVQELQAQVKWVNDSIKISIINQRIQQENMYWRAGRVTLTQLSFSEKENFFKKKFNIEGFDYYKGGLFELNSKKVIPQPEEGFVEEFDWRYRHNAHLSDSPYYDGDPTGTGWITPYANKEYYPYLDPCMGQGSLKSFRQYHHYGKNVKISGDLRVYPNPCKDFVIAEYTNGNSKDYCSLNLIDKNGKKIASFPLKRSSDQVIISSKQYSRGTYFIQLNVNGKTKAIRKIILIE